MKKRVLLQLALALTFAFSAQSVSAQTTKFGIAAGVNYPSVPESTADLDMSGRQGYQFGAMVDIKIPIFTITPEFWYSKSTSAINTMGEEKNLGSFKMESFDIPIIVSIKLFDLITIKAGPTATLWSQAQMPDGTYVDFVKSTFGYVLGGGVELGGFFVDFRYSTQFNTATIPYTNVSNTVGDLAFRMESYGIVAGYKF